MNKDSRLETDAHITHFDRRFEKTRERLIFMAETNIWKDLWQDCCNRAGVDSRHACRQLEEIVTERVKYYDSQYDGKFRPKLTPGIPVCYEKREQIE